MTKILPYCLWAVCFLSAAATGGYHFENPARTQDAFAFNQADWPKSSSPVPAAGSDIAVWGARDFFQPPEDPREDKTAPPKPAVSRLRQDYRLVAVMMDDHPMIVLEDKNRNGTFFLTRGEEVEGSRLEKIEKGKAVFDDQGQKVELWIKK